jgi:aerobic carbon-monoxide dehydrogenase small subunit
MRVTLTLNGLCRDDEVEARMLLVHYIREVAGLTGTHVGCESTLCGACTVLIDGKAVKSCTVLAVQADGSDVTTVEGLASNGKLHPIQEGFWEEHGLQCGYCTPGMIMAAADLLSRNAKPSEAEVRHAIEGNICRCTGYQHIIKAVPYAAEEMRTPDRNYSLESGRLGQRLQGDYDSGHPKFVGERIKRREDPQLISGTATYVDDVRLPGMLSAVILRSPHAHAKINSINVDAARNAPGVVCVLTGEDVRDKVGSLPCVAPAEHIPFHPMLAQGKVRYIGEAVVVAGRGRPMWNISSTIHSVFRA